MSRWPFMSRLADPLGDEDITLRSEAADPLDAQREQAINSADEAAPQPFKCLNCQDERWVCENHPNKPWDVPESEGGCECGGAGMPCALCNPCDRDNPPAFPPGTTVIERWGDS